jgi:Papain family cysteine protease
MNVDWRNRFGRNWISSVRDQGGTSNCWAFASTALYEAMVRIEHLLWTRRSEGDMVHGVGKQAWDFGNIGECVIFVERYGLADPDCFPWGESAALYTAREGGPSLEATPLSTTSDRAGRTVRVAPGAATTLTDPAQKRQWIDAVGPMATIVVPPGDFGSLHDGIYSPTVPGTGPAHALLVIGYNDDERYWIVKNSWGTLWGVGGFGKVSYDANLLEPAGFVGLRGTNPDPWSRRRMRNGTLIQGGNGALRNNFELFVRVGPNLLHWYRENADAKLPWILAGPVRSSDPWRDTWHDDALDCPAAVQSTFNRNYELIYRTTFRYLRHVWYDQAGGLWSDATIFGPLDPVGIPGFVQGGRGAPGDFEVVVVTSAGQAEHWTKHNSAPWYHGPGDWYKQQTFGANIAFGGPSLVHSRIGVTGYPENGTGELHYVYTDVNGTMHHYRRDLSSGWTPVTTFGQNITSAPCLIEGTYSAGDESGVGNFELCVAVNGQIEHWWRYNTTPGGAWLRSAVFGSDVNRVVSMIQSSYGTNLELIVERTDGHYQHYWRDGSLTWQVGAHIV